MFSDNLKKRTLLLSWLCCFSPPWLPTAPCKIGPTIWSKIASQLAPKLAVNRLHKIGPKNCYKIGPQNCPPKLDPKVGKESSQNLHQIIQKLSWNQLKIGPQNWHRIGLLRPHAAPRPFILWLIEAGWDGGPVRWGQVRWKSGQVEVGSDGGRIRWRSGRIEVGSDGGRAR
jgi:hypothetical protein